MTVRFEIDDKVALITLDRQHALNALDVPSLKELRSHLVEFRDRDDLRVAILTGDGTKAFCAGADLKGTKESPASYPEAVFRATGQAAELGLYIRLMDLTELALCKPLVAAVNGHCLGAGLELALQCDLRLASTNATFGLPEASVGSIPAVSGLHRLLKAVPAAPAMQMALTGERIDAQAALSIGLVSEVLRRGIAARPGIRCRTPHCRQCAARGAGDQEAVAPDLAPERSRCPTTDRTLLGRASRHPRPARRSSRVRRQTHTRTTSAADATTGDRPMNRSHP